MRKEAFFVRLRVFVSVFFAFLVCFCSASCKAEEAKDLVYLREASFCAELEGVLYGTEGREDIGFSALAEVDRRGGAEIYRISYRAPAELDGITVEVVRDRATGQEQVTASLGELSVALSHDAVAGWLLPVEGLLSLVGETPRSLQKTESGYRFVFPDGRLLTVDEKGMPLAFQSPKISLSVRSIQALESSFSPFCTKQHQMCCYSCKLHIDKCLFL